MPAWVPQTELWWVADVAAGGLIVGCIVVSSLMSNKISVDIFEHCEPTQLKESARNVWTNVAVTGALLLTIVIPMLQLGPFVPLFDDADDVREEIATLQELYMAFTIASLASVLLSIFQCVISLTYMEPLTTHNAIKYFIANPSSFGFPVVLLMTSCVMLCLALIMWTFGTYGLPNGVLLSILTTVVLIALAIFVVDKSLFDPTGSTPKSIEWMWTQKPESEWPTLAKRLDAKGVATFKRLGNLVAEHERQCIAEAEKEVSACRGVVGAQISVAET